MSSKELFKNRASMAVTQDHLKNQPRHIVINKDFEFLLFLEDGEKTPILLELTEAKQAKVTVNYAENRTLDLIELETPATLLGVFDLKDDSDGRFAKLCETALAIWKALIPTFDLLISSAKLGIGSTDHASDRILWWKVAGQEKGEPSLNYTITSPVIQNRLLAYELVDTEVKQFEVIRKYRKLAVDRKLDDLVIARQSGATHKDRNGNFYKKGQSGVMVSKVENGQIEWKLSQYYHMPEITERL